MLCRISCLWIVEITCTLFLDVIDIGRSPQVGVWIFCKKSIEKTNLNQCWDTGKMFIWILKGVRVECEKLRNVLQSQIVSHSILIFSTTIHIIIIYEPLIFILENFSSSHFLYKCQILSHSIPLSYSIALTWFCLWVLCF